MRYNNRFYHTTVQLFTVHIIDIALVHIICKLVENDVVFIVNNVVIQSSFITKSGGVSLVNERQNAFWRDV